MGMSRRDGKHSTRWDFSNKVSLLKNVVILTQYGILNLSNFKTFTRAFLHH